MKVPLVTFPGKDLFCERAGVYIDPSRKVKKAIITHAHSDHARAGHEHYLCTKQTAPIIRHRLGKIKIQALDFGQPININGVSISFHPAGHIVGSAQVRLEYKGEVWVVTGDYKLENDGLSHPFEVIPCTHFVTESTFALPIYQWQDQQNVIDDMNNWWSRNQSNGRISVIFGYSLGKAQRLIHSLNNEIGPIVVHPTVAQHNKAVEAAGFKLKPYMEAGEISEIPENAMVITSSSSFQASAGQHEKYATAMASGWLSLKGSRKSRTIDKAFALSDHSDWPGLVHAVKESGAKNIYVTHGYTKPFTHYLKEQGFNAHDVQATGFNDLSHADL